MWTVFQGRPTTIDPQSSTGLLWIEPAEMPTEFIGGVLVVEGDGRPFYVRAKWGGGGVTFEDIWSSVDGARLICLVPASDAFYLTGYNLYETPFACRAWISRDVRVWAGMQLPTGGGLPLVSAGGTEIVAPPIDTGMEGEAGGDEPAPLITEQGGAFQVTSGGNEWMPLFVDSGAAT